MIRWNVVVLTQIIRDYTRLLNSRPYRSKGCAACAAAQGAEGRGAKIVLIKKSIPLVNYSFMCMLEFWQRLLSMIDKVSKSLQSKDTLSTIAQLLGCLDVKK